MDVPGGASRACETATRQGSLIEFMSPVKMGEKKPMLHRFNFAIFSKASHATKRETREEGNEDSSAFHFPASFLWGSSRWGGQRLAML